MNRQYKKHYGNQYIKSYDGIRALALMGVVFFHMNPDRVTGGFLGVVTFLVLAGYLSMRKLTIMDINGEKQNPFSLIFTRLKKLYPQLVFMILAVTLFLYFYMSEFLPSLKYQAISGLFGVNNIAQIIHGESYFEGIGLVKPLTHLWALSLEMQLYVIFYLMMGTGYKRKDRGKWALCFLLLTVLSIVSLNFNYRGEESLTRVYYGTDTRMFSFFIGALGAVIFMYKKPEIKRKNLNGALGWLLLVFTTLAFVLLKNDTLMYRIWLPLYSLAMLALILIARDRSHSVTRFLENSFFRYLSSRSYALYLWHFPIIRIVEKMTAFWTVNRYAVYGLELLLSLIAAEISTRIFESKIKNGTALAVKRGAVALAMVLTVAFPYRAHGEGAERLAALQNIRDSVEDSSGEEKAVTTENSEASNNGKTAANNDITEDEPVKLDESVNFDKDNEEGKADNSQGQGEKPVEIEGENQENSGSGKDSGSNENPDSGENSETGESGDSDNNSGTDEAGDSGENSGTDETGDSDNNSGTDENKPKKPKKKKKDAKWIKMDNQVKTLNKKYPEIAIPLVLYDKYRYVECSLIGDSLTTIAHNYISEYLPNMNIDAKGNRQMHQAYEFFKNLKDNDKLGEALVLALGTNGEINPKDVDKIRKAAGGIPIIMMSINLPYPGQEASRNKNIYNYVKEHDNVYIADWHKYCKKKKELFGPDDIHPTGKGSQDLGFIITGSIIRALEEGKNAENSEDF